MLAEPSGPTCHLGSVSCFGDAALDGPGWFAELLAIVGERAACVDEASYTRELLDMQSAALANASRSPR